MSDRVKIMKRLSEHLEAVRDKHHEWVGIFLQGSQNYNLDYEGSDIDSKLIVLPSFEDFVLNKRPYSYTHIMENDEHVDVKDIRLMLDCFKKQNVNFVEILFTPYRILNPKYEALFQPILDIAERVGRYNNYAALNCMVGMALEKQKALCHPYPATKDKIDKYGFDSKQYHHIERLYEFMQRWLNGEPYRDCLISNQRERLREIKLYINCDLTTAQVNSDRIVSEMKSIKDTYMQQNPVVIDREVDSVFNKVLLDLFKFNFQCELGNDSPNKKE